jgi:uncharacterized protein
MPYWHMRSRKPGSKTMSKFEPLAYYQRSLADGYKLMPFRFVALDDQEYVLTNQAGEFLVTNRPILEALVRHRLSADDPAYDDLKSKHFLASATQGAY